MKSFIHKSKIFALTLGVCAAAFTANITNVQAASFTDEQTQELETLFKEFLANNPEAILESVETYRADQEKKTQQSALENLKEYQSYFQQDNRPMAGNPEGDVTVVEFFDYNCGYCHKAFEDIMTLLNEDKNIRVVFQEMPILSPSSRTMAAMALAAHKQGKYFEMHQGLMNLRGPQSEEAFTKTAEEAGLDIVKMKEDAQSADVTGAISKSMDVGRLLGIRGTPGFIIGDKIFPGYIGIEAMRKAIEEARAAKAE